MTFIFRTAFAALGLLALAACASDYGPRYGEQPSVSIPYDPYDFSPDDLQAEADNHCSAHGLRAVYDGETINPDEVRWRYRHFLCV